MTRPTRAKAGPWGVCLWCTQIRTTIHGDCRRCGIGSVSIHYTLAEAEAAAVMMSDRAVRAGYPPATGEQMELAL